MLRIPNGNYQKDVHRVFARGNKTATIVSVDLQKTWTSTDVSLGGAWAFGCTENYGKVLGKLWIQFHGNGAPIAIDMAVVAKPHPHSKQDERGLTFQKIDADNKKRLFEFMPENVAKIQ